MDEEVRQLTDQIAKLEAILVENREKQTELRTQLDKVPGDMKEAEARIIAEMVPKIVDLQKFEALEKSHDELTTKLQRMGETAEQTTGKTLHENAFAEYIRCVDDSVKSENYAEFAASDEYRALSESVGTEGGFLVDPVIEREIIIDTITEISPIRTIARVTVINSKELNLKRRTGTPTGGWVGESTKSDESSSTYGDFTIPVHPLDIFTRSSRDFLADVPGAESEVATDAAEDLGQVEGVAFVSGNGVNKPEGFMTNADIGSITGAGAATDVIHQDDFSTMFTTLKAAYWTGAKWGFNQDTLGKIMLLVDAVNGSYIWQPGLAQGFPQSIMGLPYVIMQDMESEGTDANEPVILGNFMKGYRIVDRGTTEVTRDPYSAKPDIEFLWRRRLGGRVVVAEAFQKLVV